MKSAPNLFRASAREAFAVESSLGRSVATEVRGVSAAEAWASHGGFPAWSGEAATGGGPTLVVGSPQKYVNIIPEERAAHILYGDAPGSGGHLWPGQPGKTPFPQNWSAEKILHEVSDIVTNPSTKWYAQTGSGGIYTSAKDPARWISYEVRDGVRIRVVYEPATGYVRTAFPDNAPMPNYKSIK